MHGFGSGRCRQPGSHSTDGRKIEMSNRTETARQLSAIISQRVAEHKLPQALADLRNGLTLTFGPCSLSSDGLIRKSRRNATLPWKEVSGVRVGRGSVLIYQGPQKYIWGYPIGASKIPNFALFLTLIAQMTRTK